MKIRLGSKDREIDELKTDIRKLGDKTPLDAKFKDLSSQIEIWRNKANLLEEQWDKEQKRSKDLQESRDKFEQDLKNVKNDLDQAKRLIAKYENTVLELERLRSEAEISRKKHEELEVFRKRNEELESRIKSLISELETLKQRLGSFEDIPEKHLKELEIWSNRCDEIEREWSEKYKQLEFEMDELSLMANNLKEFEDQILLLQAENENWKQKCLEIESEWSQKHAQALRSLPEDLKHGNSLEKQELIGALFLLMLEVERLNMLIKLLEEEKDKTLEFSHLKHQEKEKKAVFDRDLQGATAKLEEIIKSKEGVIENFRQKLKENEGRIEKVTRENAILKERVKKFDDDSRFQADSLKGSLESEIRRLKLLNESLQQETEQFRSKYYEEMRKKGDNFENENRICLLAAENERLTKENEVLMRKYSEEINKGNKGGTEIENRLALAINDKERLLRELEQYKYKQNEEDRLLRELDQYKSKYYEEVSKKTPSTYEIENKLALITTENTRLLSENDYWRRVSQEAEEKMRKTTENSFTTKAQSSYLEQDFKEKNKALIEENEEIKLKITRLENEYKRFVENSSANSSEVMNLEFEIEMKGKKLRELELLLQDKNEFSSIRSEQLFKENERIKSELEEQKRKFSILELENYKRGSTDNEFTRKTGVLEAELDRIRSLLEDKTRETKGLMENNMQKARDYEESLMRLRIAENQMAVLDSKTKGLIEEIEAWRSRYENLERFKAREFEDLRTHTEAIRKSQLDREIRDLTIKHQNERMKLEAENKRLEGLLELRNGELVILKGRDQREGKIPRLEERVFLLTSEIERLLGLTQSLNEKIHELEDGKLRLSEFYQDQQKSNFETTKKSQVYQVENLQNEVNVLQKDLEEWKGKARRAELEIYGVSTMNQTISELKQQIQVLNKDQQGLIESLKEKTNYIEKLKLKKRGLKSKIRSSFSPEQANSSYYREIEALKSENQLIKEELSKKSFEKQGETEVKVRYLEQELREKEQDLSEWRQKYYQAKSEGTYLVKPQEEFLPIQRSPVHEEHIKKAFIHEGENLQSKVNALTEELETWKDKCHRLESSSAEKSLWEKKARDWEQKVQILLADNERLIMEKTLLEQRFISSSSETLDRSKLQRLEEQRMQEIEELKMHLELLKTAGLVDSHGLEYEAERIAYETALNQMKARIMELERSLAIAERDAEENKKLFGGKLREVEELRGKGIGFTSQTRVSGDLDDLKIENDRLKRMCSVNK